MVGFFMRFQFEIVWFELVYAASLFPKIPSYPTKKSKQNPIIYAHNKNNLWIWADQIWNFHHNIFLILLCFSPFSLSSVLCSIINCFSYVPRIRFPVFMSHFDLDSKLVVHSKFCFYRSWVERNNLNISSWLFF